MSDLAELIVCTECKTRVEYHDDRDGYMSCECWIKGTQEEPYPSKWLEIEDRKINECGGCKKDISERLVFRCADCGLPFHRACLDHHCKHGNQPQELRSNNLFLAAENASLRSESAMFKERWELEQIRYEGISSANEELRKELKDARGQLCRAREALSDEGEFRSDTKRVNDANDALSSFSPCAHAEEAKRRSGTIINLIRALTTAVDMLESVEGVIVKDALIVMREGICFPEGRRAEEG